MEINRRDFLIGGAAAIGAVAAADVTFLHSWSAGVKRRGC